MRYAKLALYGGLFALGIVGVYMAASEGYRFASKTLSDASGKRTAGTDAAGRPAALTASQPSTTSGAGAVAAGAVVASPVPPVP